MIIIIIIIVIIIVLMMCKNCQKINEALLQTITSISIKQNCTSLVATQKFIDHYEYNFAAISSIILRVFNRLFRTEAKV